LASDFSVKNLPVGSSRSFLKNCIYFELKCNILHKTGERLGTKFHAKPTEGANFHTRSGQCTALFLSRLESRFT
jgi:hypothetical protein